MSTVHTAARRLRRAGAKGEELLHRALAGAGMTQSENRIAADAQAYWTDTGGQRWQADSHWRDASVFGGTDLWARIGREHLAMLDRGARATGFDRPWNRVVEWGCGGGANAVHVAPRCAEFVGVDIAEQNLAECGRQVAEVCQTPFRPVLVQVGDPEAAVAELGPGSCDVFLCCYVFELIPTPEYGARLLRIARELLVPGGLALIQIKYDEGRFRTRPRRRAYRRGLADMTTYPIPEFWELVEACGLRPQWVELVPENELDRRYAYFLLTR